jgi:hypothetical protein
MLWLKEAIPPVPPEPVKTFGFLLRGSVMGVKVRAVQG